jgi:hypothetical protein
MGLMSAFEYSPVNLSEIERTLSADRLRPYRESVGGDDEAAIRLYEQNTLLAESLYSVLQGLEIPLRNTIHAQLASDYGRAEWYDTLKLEPEQSAMLRKAKDSLVKEGKLLDAGRVVAELSFGFWTGLTGPKYDVLWRDHLVKIFPRRPVQRVEVQTRLNSIRKLRNRIAHHEPILFSGRLQKYVNQIFDTISWMSPVTARWVRSNSSFDDRFATYRRIFPLLGGGRP